MKEKLIKLEPYYFYLFLILNLIPVLSHRFFLTVDGPAHLYNSRIIVELVSNSNSPIEQFFNFNTQISPNWSGHFILSSFMFFLPAFVAEKIVLIICLIGLPLSLRYLLKTLNVKSYYFIYMVFPFTYSFLFYYGFYNFNLGIILLLFGISFWIKMKDDYTFKKSLKLFIISTLICLTHLFIFSIFLLSIFILNLNSFKLFFQSDKIVKQKLVKNYFFQLLILSPAIILFLVFQFNNQSTGTNPTYLIFQDILSSLKYIMPAKGINYEGYSIFNKVILYIFLLLYIYLFWKKFLTKKTDKVKIFKHPELLILSFILLLFSFFLPDSSGSFSFITSRFLLLFFLFLLIWTAIQDVPNAFKILIFTLLNIVNTLIISHNYHSIKKGCELAEETNKISELIKPYSVVLPINLNNSKIYDHISNYLGVDKPMVIIENYEALLNYFPLKWNPNKQNISSALQFNSDSDFSYIASTKDSIDYIFQIADPENFKLLDLDSVIEKKYTLIYTGKNKELKLFKLK